MLNIIFLDGYTINPGDLDWSPLEGVGNFKVFDRTADEDVLTRSAEADVIITNKVKLGERAFSALPRLRLVCVAATGYDCIDTEAARRHGILVTNCAGYSTQAVGQMTLSLLLEACDGVGEYTRRNRQGEWTESKDFCYTFAPRIPLQGKRVCIVGWGNIGKQVASLLRPFGVKLFAVTSKQQSELPTDVQRVESLAEAFRTCDVVSLHCPLTSQNRECVNGELLLQANPQLILINTARGALVNEADVAEALREGRLGAYCTDVLAQEPPFPSNPLFAAPRTFITPHIAWATPTARGRIIQLLCESIRNFAAGTPVFVVNDR